MVKFGSIFHKSFWDLSHELYFIFKYRKYPNIQQLLSIRPSISMSFAKQSYIKYQSICVFLIQKHYMQNVSWISWYALFGIHMLHQFDFKKVFCDCMTMVPIIAKLDRLVVYAHFHNAWLKVGYERFLSSIFKLINCELREVILCHEVQLLEDQVIHNNV
jgi:hypothetical protein